MGYVSLLLALLFYIYAVAGIHLFGAQTRRISALAGGVSLAVPARDARQLGGHLQCPVGHVPGIKVAIYFVTFIVFGTMIILNLFIGIIMNSMAEMHAEIAERDRAQHERETGAATLEDELRTLEQELKETQTRMAGLRRKWARAGATAASERKPEEIAA